MASVTTSPDGMQLFSTGDMDNGGGSPWRGFIYSHSIVNGSVARSLTYNTQITLPALLRWVDGYVYMGGIHSGVYPQNANYFLSHQYGVGMYHPSNMTLKSLMLWGEDSSVLSDLTNFHIEKTGGVVTSVGYCYT